jgi:hypothetical protein
MQTLHQVQVACRVLFVLNNHEVQWHRVMPSLPGFVVVPLAGSATSVWFYYTVQRDTPWVYGTCTRET